MAETAARRVSLCLTGCAVGACSAGSGRTVAAGAPGADELATGEKSASALEPGYVATDTRIGPTGVLDTDCCGCFIGQSTE